VQQAQGQVFVAQQHLTALLDTIPVSLPLLAQEIQTALARLALSAGDQITMQRWVTGHTPHQDFSQEIEEELLVSRWLRTQGKLDEASRQLERLLATAQKGDQTRHLLEIQVELVLLADARKQKEEAQHRLRDVLAQALDRNALRVFVDAGEQMAVLLRSLLHQLLDRPSLAFIRALLSAFPIQPQNGAQTQSASLVDPLSPQEMRVLRLLVEHRSNADIAKALVVSINTVRTQVQSIYTKLGVHKRTAASEVARDLHLL
jgi:LuxR family maltose regulon positive regulatory protein